MVQHIKLKEISSIFLLWNQIEIIVKGYKDLEFRDWQVASHSEKPHLSVFWPIRRYKYRYQHLAFLLCHVCATLKHCISTSACPIPTKYSIGNKLMTLCILSEFALCRVRQDRLSHSLMYIYLYFARKLNRLKNKKLS